MAGIGEHGADGLLNPDEGLILHGGADHGVELADVVGLVGHRRDHDDPVLVHHRLGVVALDPALRGLHDAAVGVGGVRPKRADVNEGGLVEAARGPGEMSRRTH
ncbi:MAG TPA: hypothetical protein VI916_07535, partial [Acidimicrobiia bacterium]|nr:hypothetical protein [Acidimicrobiia bacterium]